MGKSDRRIQYTKQVIKQSLLDMLRTTPIEQITVKGLCEKADINRATFYNHYETLAVLLEELEYETYKALLAKLTGTPFDQEYVPLLLRTVLQHLQQSPSTRDLFLSKATAGSGLIRVLEEQQENDLPYPIRSTINPKQSQWILTYMSSGIREVLRQWYKGKQEDEELLIETLSLFINSGIQAFLKTN